MDCHACGLPPTLPPSLKLWSDKKATAGRGAMTPTAKQLAGDGIKTNKPAYAGLFTFNF